MSSSAKQRGGGRSGGNVSNDNSNSSSSSSVIGSNFDILTLILTRLPLKSLLVFKSVSKQWLSLITDPKFVHKHFLQNPSLSISGLFVADGHSSMYFSFPLDGNGNANNHVPFETLSFINEKLGFRIIQSCNGLVLGSSREHEKTDPIFHIFNPFTKKLRTLPQPQLTRRGFRELKSVSLAFDPFKSPYYKVVSIWTRTPNTTEYRIEIYDSETSSWKLSEYVPDVRRAKRLPSLPGIFWNGSLYWCFTFGGSVVYFDIDRELIEVVPNPSPVQGNEVKNYKIAECRGHFYLVAIRYANRCFDIFRMDAAHTGWNLKGRIDLRLNPHSYFGESWANYHCYLDHILFIAEGEEEEKLAKVVLLTKERKIVSYDLVEMSIENIHDLSPQGNFPVSPMFYQNIESLACV